MKLHKDIKLLIVINLLFLLSLLSVSVCSSQENDITGTWQFEVFYDNLRLIEPDLISSERMKVIEGMINTSRESHLGFVVERDRNGNYTIKSINPHTYTINYPYFTFNEQSYPSPVPTAVGTFYFPNYADIFYEGQFLNENNASGTFRSVSYQQVAAKDPSEVPFNEPMPKEWIATHEWEGRIIGEKSIKKITEPVTGSPIRDSSATVEQALAAAIIAALMGLVGQLMNKSQMSTAVAGQASVYQPFQITQTGPPVNEQGQVFYQPPWDEGGAYWMNGDEYRRMQEMQAQGKVWSNAYGWIERQDLSERQASWQESLDAAADEAWIRKTEQDMLIEQRRLENEYEQARLDYIHELRNKVSDLEHQAFMDQRAIQFSYQEGIRGTAREIFTGVGQKWDPESGQYIDSLSYSSMGLRILTGVATGGTSEYIYKPVWSAYSVNDRLERGENLFDAIMGTGDALAKQYAGGQVLKAASPYISYGMNRATGYIPDSVKSAGSAIKNTLTKPRSLPFGSEAARLSPVTKPVPLAPELAPTKKAVTNALNIKDPVKQAEAIKKLYSDNGMNNLRALEQSGHLTAEQANQINQAMTREVNKAVNDATTRNLNSFRVSEKIATKNGMVVKDVYKVEGVKVEQVMIGDSGSSSAVKIFKNKGRSIYTDHDRTVHVTFDPQEIKAYARAKNITPHAAQRQLNAHFTENQTRFMNDSFNRSGLNPNDVDAKFYSGLGGKAGQADSYPGGFTSVRQATQGRTEVFKINSQAQVSSYKTSGQAFTDQGALDRFNYTGKEVSNYNASGQAFTDQAANYTGKNDWLQSGGPKIANANRAVEGKALLSHQIPHLNNPSNIQEAAKALERFDKGLVLMDSPIRVPPETLRLANYIRNNPQNAYSIRIDQQQELLREAAKLAEQAGELL